MSEEITLNWDDHPKAFVGAFERWLEQSTFADCTISAGGQHLKAHRIVLSVSSWYFEMLLSQEPEKYPILILQNIKFYDLKKIIEFIYHGFVKLQEDDLHDFIEAANTLQIKGLKLDSLRNNSLGKINESPNTARSDRISRKRMRTRSFSSREENTSGSSLGSTNSSESQPQHQIEGNAPLPSPQSVLTCSTLHPTPSGGEDGNFPSGNDESDLITGENVHQEPLDDIIEGAVVTSVSIGSQLPPPAAKVTPVNPAACAHGDVPASAINLVGTAPLVPTTSSSRTAGKQSSRRHGCRKKTFVNPSQLAIHMRKHTGDRPFKCDRCAKTFKQNRLLRRHQRIHAGDHPFKCDDCGKAFTQKYELQNHLSIQTGERPYKCKVCGKAFTQAGNLMTHQHIHEEDRPFKCEECGKAFMRNDHLRSHQRIHTDDRPYKCEVCEKTFTKKGDLRNHLRIHTGERPYKCNVCGKAFTRASYLISHQRIHTDDRRYQCDVCEKAFTKKGDLRNHLRIHTGERPYKCNVCDKAFTESGHLRRHQRIHRKACSSASSASKPSP